MILILIILKNNVISKDLINPTVIIYVYSLRVNLIE